MSWVSRNEKCLRANTPEHVGPGSYQIAPTRQQRTSTAPFDSGEPRLNVSTSQNSPGFYLGHKVWGSKPRTSSAFGSRAVRMAEIKDICPGPGSYNLSSQSTSRYKQEKHLPLQMEIYRTAPSIPSREVQPYNLGPGSYDPVFSENKPESRGTAFGAYVSKREVFESFNQSHVGPGQYSVSEEKGSKNSWMFTSGSRKPPNEKVVKKEGPGPGSYEIAGKHVVKEAPASFGSNAKRDIKVTSDPHRPYIAGACQVPPVGSYLSKEEQDKIDKLKKMLITADYPVDKAPFGTSEKRIIEISSETPGPGYYQPLIQQNQKGLLPNKSPRFAKENEATPGPGAYQMLSAASQRARTITSKAPRFEKVKSKPSQGHTTYSKHTAWEVKQSRSPDFALIDKNLSFDSTSGRFIQKKLLGPGPGEYEPKSASGPRSSTKFGGHRSKYYGDFRPQTGTPLKVGPGTYELSESSRITFNMSKELGKDNIWL